MKYRPILLENIPSYLEEQSKKLDDEGYWILYANVKSFLRSCFFRVKDNPDWVNIKKSVEGTLDKICNF